ncbi:hypothetical protein NQ318_021483 [Aromia moschata]|uniref:Nuclear pore complex protein Nup155 n=1 Tax=Aromia moschata TaxID=1265417 RepID=A0AAV8ZEB1_9CUCU|nr:hypothetical protein NQ318_021483 [Aromia moschata]
MNVNPQTGSTASGLTDQDYPTLSGMPLTANNLTQIKCVSNVPLPPEIVDHFTHIQCHCMMGLFAEINRAWLTVDSDIYVWTYEENTDLAYFDGINETILCVGLVKPKPKVFQSYIKHLLVLTTAVDIIVLGVTFSEGPNGPMDEIQLIPDPVFTMPTDGVTVSSIAGTSEGRLFLGTKEGSLYEICYQKVNLSTSALSFLVPSFLNAALSEEDGICQISVDNSRHLLYTLTEKGAIEVCDLGEKGNSFSRVTKLSQSSLVTQAMNTVKTLDSQNFRPIVSISAMEAYESGNINLVAVSQTGVRFYMSVVGLSNMQPNQRPYTFTLVHVRLPPGYSANVTVRPRAVHISHHRDRNLMLISTVNEKDVLWCMSSDLFPFSQTLMEAYNTVSLDGPALAIAEMRHNTHQYDCLVEAPPMVVRQHSEAPHKYVVLTSQGIQVFIKLRPVDLLKQILQESHGHDTDALKAFFMIQKDEQGCATSLILASLESDDNMEIAEYATRVFFMFGGEPKVTQMNTTNVFAGTTMFSPNIISTPAPPHFQQSLYPQSPNLSQALSPEHASFDVQSLFTFSSKHNGLYLYLGRILRPIWNRRCIENICMDGRTVTNQSTISSEECIYILNNLTALHSFLMRNTQLSAPRSAPAAHNSMFNNTSMNLTRANYTLHDAQLDERQSLDALKVFVCHCCQIMGLWRILCEHQFHSLIGALPDNQQQILQNTTFKDLFLYRQDICSVLITTLVNSYLSDNASVDSISAKLREVCPHLYRTEDAAFSKASEILKSSRTIQNLDEKEELIYSALQLCKTISPHINLAEVCKEFTSLKAYKAVIELCFDCGKKIDPDKIAESFYNSDDNVADQEGYNYFQKRMEIYKQILSMLENLYAEQNQEQGSNVQERNYLTNQTVLINGTDEPRVGLVMQEVINEILDCPDEILHIALYEWMVSKNMTGDLIKIGKSSLETYLKRTAVQHPDNIPVMDLLWKFYESNNNHTAAAKILNSLASRRGNTIPLKDRLSYLARAIMCMRSDKVGYAPHLGIFLRDLEDKMEVAKVQEQILEAVVNLQSQIPNAQEVILALNSELFEISQLYENFAEPFNLLECQLAIIDCAGYTDTSLIESIWQQILSDEIKKTTGSGNDRMGQILTKVKYLSRQYAHSTHCFPLSYIVYELEIVNAKLKGDKYLVPMTLVSINIPFEKLISVYNNLITISVNDHFWQVEENEFHLSEATAALINCFLNNHESYNSVEKRKITSLCQDTVAALLSNLYSKPNTDYLVNQLRNIQAKLSRI